MLAVSNLFPTHSTYCVNCDFHRPQSWFNSNAEVCDHCWVQIMEEAYSCSRCHALLDVIAQYCFDCNDQILLERYDREQICFFCPSTRNLVYIEDLQYLICHKCQYVHWDNGNRAFQQAQIQEGFSLSNSGFPADLIGLCIEFAV